VFERTEVYVDGSACFEQEDPVMPRPIKSIFLDKQTFEELGEPTVITIEVTAP
jgi:hypothetical protein